MPPPVRVIGRIDLAETIRETLRAAGFDADVVTAGPMAAYRGTPPAEGVDVVVATSIFDPPLWTLAKARHPRRPMVAVAERRRERALRGAVLRRAGPDEYVTLPVTPQELATAVRRAESAASRTRSWSTVDLGSALVGAGFATVGFGFGFLLIGVGLMIGLPYAWNLRWQAVGSVALLALGAWDVARELLPLWLG